MELEVAELESLAIDASCSITNRPVTCLQLIGDTRHI